MSKNMNDNKKRNETLFILATLGMGGTATSMINLLSLLKEHYRIECDVLLFHKDGVFTEEMNNKFHILDTDPVLWFLAKDKKEAFRKKPFFSFAMITIYVFLSLILGKRYRAKLYLYKQRAKKYSNQYKVIVAYQEESITSFASYIMAEHRIAWLHNSIDRLPTYHDLGIDFLRDTYGRFDRVICVSEATRRNFLQYIPGFENKTGVIYNPFLGEEIIRKSDEYLVERPKAEFVFLSIGRFAKQKRFDKIIEAAKMLKGDNVDFVWLIIGGGELFDNIKNMVLSEKMNEFVVLVGAQRNPFPYYKISDFLVITSDYEAHPMVANEALILNKPVISTKLPSIGEIVVDGQNGIIADGTEAEDIYIAMKRLIEDKKLIEKIRLGAEQMKYNNEPIIAEVRDLLCRG